MRILALALMTIGAGCTTLPPSVPFPEPPPLLMTECSRPEPMPEVMGLTAHNALSTVTDNYARHHACADRLDSLQEWVKGQGAVK